MERRGCEQGLRHPRWPWASPGERGGDVPEALGGTPEDDTLSASRAPQPRAELRDSGHPSANDVFLVTDSARVFVSSTLLQNAPPVTWLRASTAPLSPNTLPTLSPAGCAALHPENSCVAGMRAGAGGAGLSAVWLRGLGRVAQPLRTLNPSSLKWERREHRSYRLPGRTRVAAPHKNSARLGS